MRVLMLSPEFSPNLVGGMGKHVEDLTPALGRHGVEVHLVTRGDSGGLSVEQTAPGVTVYRANMSGNTMGALLTDTETANWQMSRLAEEVAERAGPFHLIHGHEWLVAFAAARLKNALRIPMVITIHGTERGRYRGELYTELSRAIHRIEDDLCAAAARVIVTSYYMAHEVVSYFGVPQEKVDVVPNAVKTAPYERLAHEDLSHFRRRFASDEESIIFYVGRLVHEKGLQVLVAAAPRIMAQVPRVKFVIAGRGPMVDELRLQAERQGTGHAFYFTGYISDEDRDRLYKVADVAVFPSLYEPFGIVALEAMAARVPVVVSGVGGLREVVENHVTGITAYPNNPESLSWAIVHTLKRPDWAAARVANAYRRVLENFSWDMVANQTRAVYERAFEESRTSSRRWHEDGP